MRTTLVLTLATLMGCSSSKTLNPRLTVQSLGQDVLTQAISIVNDSTVWISGHEATFARTTDGGRNWLVFSHPTMDSLQFRDIHAFDASKVILMSAGEGSNSRIFSVIDGVIWREHFVMDDPKGFLDCIAFWDDKNGIAYGDAIDEYPYILLTNNGGRSWKRSDTSSMPKSGKGEGGFAASGRCVETGPNGQGWIVTGAGGNARVLLTTDYGNSWTAIDAGMVKGAAAGHTAVEFLNSGYGFTSGGDLGNPDGYTANVFISDDFGRTWEPTSRPQTRGAFYGCAIIPGDKPILLACGPNGIDFSSDSGKKWVQLDSANYWAVDGTDSGIAWAVGAGGRILRVDLKP